MYTVKSLIEDTLFQVFRFSKSFDCHKLEVRLLGILRYLIAIYNLVSLSHNNNNKINFYNNQVTM